MYLGIRVRIWLGATRLQELPLTTLTTKGLAVLLAPLKETAFKSCLINTTPTTTQISKWLNSVLISLLCSIRTTRQIGDSKFSGSWWWTRPFLLIGSPITWQIILIYHQQELSMRLLASVIHNFMLGLQILLIDLIFTDACTFKPKTWLRDLWTSEFQTLLSISLLQIQPLQFAQLNACRTLLHLLITLTMRNMLSLMSNTTS